MVFGAVLGTALVGFAVLAGLLIRDLVLSGRACTVDLREGLAGIALEACFKRRREAARHLW